MTDKLETFIDAHLEEFDEIEPPKDLWVKIDARAKHNSVKSVKSKMLSKWIYLGLSSLLVALVIYFVSQDQQTKMPVSIENPNETLENTENPVSSFEKTKHEVYTKQEENTYKNKAALVKTEGKDFDKTDTVNKANSISLPLDSPQVDLKEFEGLVDISGVPRHIFYHISYVGGPINNKKSHKLAWYLHKEIPNTYYIVEHYIWNKWVERVKIKSGKSRPGRTQYSGEIKGKYAYSLHLPPHSGENRWRVVLTDSNSVQLAVSKELFGIDDKGKPIHFISEVKYNIKNKTKEVVFSDDAYYELYDSFGKLVKEGRANRVPYADLEKGTYILNYDNSTTSIKLK